MKCLKIWTILQKSIFHLEHVWNLIKRVNFFFLFLTVMTIDRTWLLALERGTIPNTTSFASSSIIILISSIYVKEHQDFSVVRRKCKKTIPHRIGANYSLLAAHVYYAPGYFPTWFILVSQRTNEISIQKRNVCSGDVRRHDVFCARCVVLCVSALVTR